MEIEVEIEVEIAVAPTLTSEHLRCDQRLGACPHVLVGVLGSARGGTSSRRLRRRRSCTAAGLLDSGGAAPGLVHLRSGHRRSPATDGDRRDSADRLTPLP